MFNTRLLIVAAAALSTLASLQADEPPPLPPQEIERIKQLENDSQLLGSWDQQFVLLDSAADNVFNQQGWNSESDLYARQLMRDVGRVPYWKPRDRQKIFMDSLQARYGLTENQRGGLDTQIQQQTMMVTAKHFKDILPVAMEVIRTRADGKPFTAEQVQRWSKAFKPIMADALSTTQQVVEKLKDELPPDRRQLLEQDMQALMKRHRDVEKMVQRWEQGQWSPADWGLQNDPLHAAAMAEAQAKSAQQDALVNKALSNRPLDENINVADESAWDRYVKMFCDRYECTDAQRTSAQAILSQSKQEAFTLLNTRRKQVQKLGEQVGAADTPDKKKVPQDELTRLLAPVNDVFNRMKARLFEQILTTEQRKKFPPPQAPQQPAARPTPEAPAAPQPASQQAPAQPQPAQSPPPAPTAQPNSQPG